MFTKPGSLQNRAVPESRSCCPLQAKLEMAEVYRKEFEELSALAEKCLRGPAKHRPYHRTLLRLWRYPSFDQWTSWLVYVPVGRYTESDSPIVVEVIWNRRFDYERFSNPMKGLAHGFSTAPTVTLREAEVPLVTLNSQLLSLQQISAPLLIGRSVVLDGEQFGLETFGNTAAFRLSWWSIAEEAWQPIVCWAEETRDFLSSCLTGQSVHNV